MANERLGTVSAWMRTTEKLTFARAGEDLSTDVCIVGGGIAGMSIAYLLSMEGRAVVVLDDGEIGSGQTGRTTAHLASAQDDRFTELEKMHGEEVARLAGQSHAEAIDQIERIVKREKIDCDFTRVDGYLFEPPGGDVERLNQELLAARRAKLEVEMLDRSPLAFDTGPCLRFANQGQFHPLKYLAGLARAVEREGGVIFTHSHVTEARGGEKPVVKTANATITAAQIVIATNTPINDMVVMHTKQEPYRTYVLAFRVPTGVVPVGLYWDDADPYHYVRLQRGTAQQIADLLIVGGEDHKTGQQPADSRMPFSNLERWTRERFPEAGEIAFRWSGQVLEPVDGLAYIGHNPRDERNVYIVTGDSGQGMTHGTIAGMLITDLILGRDNIYAAMYDPRRKPTNAAKEFAKANLNVAAQYKDWATSGEVGSEEEIKPGTGALLRKGMHKLAVYRDDTGELHRHSATCTHLGCIVHYNPIEKSWDCPCHGSRFSVEDGSVLEGPANSGLASGE